MLVSAPWTITNVRAQRVKCVRHCCCSVRLEQSMTPVCVVLHSVSHMHQRRVCFVRGVHRCGVSQRPFLLYKVPAQ